MGGKGPFGLSSQGDGAMPRTTRRASTSRALPPFFKNRFNQITSVTECLLIKRIRTSDLIRILPSILIIISMKHGLLIRIRFVMPLHFIVQCAYGPTRDEPSFWICKGRAVQVLRSIHKSISGHAQWM